MKLIERIGILCERHRKTGYRSDARDTVIGILKQMYDNNARGDVMFNVFVDTMQMATAIEKVALSCAECFTVEKGQAQSQYIIHAIFKFDE